MRWPNLVLPQYCDTDIKVEINLEGISEEGEPITAATYEGKCNYQDSARRIYLADKTFIEVTGKALFTGDIFPQVENISSGTAIVLGVKREIGKGAKVRNPDGTVNYTQLDLR